MILFYGDDIETTCTLSDEESAHCCRVLRKHAGDVISVADGKGKVFQCRITDASSHATKVEIIDETTVEKPWKGNIIMAVAPTKNIDRMEWMVEKMVEIGVDEIVPVVCRHSERKEMKLARLQRIIVSAFKQSLKSYMPMIHEMMTFNNFMDYSRKCDAKFIAYCDEAQGKSYLCKKLTSARNTAILIGPEGDFSADEVTTALNRGFVAVSLGECRLRTETAALRALDTFHILQDISLK